MAKYNGHRSWNAWNVSLWLNNEEGPYLHAVELVRKYGRRGAACILAHEYDGQQTPDGALYNQTCLYEALEGME